MNTAREFSNRLSELLATERRVLAQFLRLLAEFDRRKLYRELGHPTLFSFLHVGLKLSAGAAQYRKTAAELIQRFPAIDAAIEGGRLCLSSVVEVAKVLTPENEAEVLPRFYGLSARAAAFVSAAMRPVANPPRREVLVPVPGPEVSAAAGAEPMNPPAIDAAPLLAFRASEVARAEPVLVSLVPPVPLPPPPAPARAAPPKPSSFEPLDGEGGRLHVTIPLALYRKIEILKSARLGATTAEVLEAAVDALLDQRAKRKGIGAKPRKTPRPAKPDTVTAELTRALFERSGGRCEWVFESGERCNSAVRPERDHVQPRGRGGPTTLANMRMLCRGHNDLAARQIYGDAWMDRFTGKRRPSASSVLPG